MTSDRLTLGFLSPAEMNDLRYAYSVLTFSETQYQMNRDLYSRMFRSLQHRYHSPVPVEYDPNTGEVYITQDAAPTPEPDEEPEPEELPPAPPPDDMAAPGTNYAEPPKQPSRAERRKKKKR